METAAKSALTPEFVVLYRELILSTIAAEMQATKKVIAAIPEDRKGYKPDPKSRTAHELAWHIVNDDVGFLNQIADMKIEMTPPAPPPASIAEMLKWYTENLPKAIQRVGRMTAEQLLTPVDFFGVMKQPVFQYLMLVNNHSVHHRGQLATYLRPMGSKVPSIYGGSADEPFQM
ncbi:MAG: DinB family protein [Terriglobales bacterium]